MIGQRQKAPIELAFLATEHRIDHRLEVVVDHLLRHTTKEGECPIMGIQYHLLRLTRIGDHKHRPAIRQTKVRKLDRLRHTAEHHMLITPIELTDFTGRKRQGYKGLRNSATHRRCCFPYLHMARNTVIRPVIARRLQALKQAAGGATLRLGQGGIEDQPLIELFLIGTELWLELSRPLIGRVGLGAQVLLDRITREIQRTGDGTDALPAHEMSTANLADGFHAKHSRMTSAKTAECGTTGGGQIWTLFLPDFCSVLHAVLQTITVRRDATVTPGGLKVESNTVGVESLVDASLEARWAALCLRVLDEQVAGPADPIETEMNEAAE